MLRHASSSKEPTGRSSDPRASRQPIKVFRAQVSLESPAPMPPLLLTILPPRLAQLCQCSCPSPARQPSFGKVQQFPQPLPVKSRRGQGYPLDTELDAAVPAALALHGLGSNGVCSFAQVTRNVVFLCRSLCTLSARGFENLREASPGQ